MIVEIETDFGPITLNEKEAELIDFKPYRGNKLLKRAGVKVKWTPKLMVEATKCAKDPIYFIENYVKVINLDKGLIPFTLRNYQKTLINNINENRNTITTMARQSGKSTAVTAYILWYILFSTHKTVLLLANKADTAREILGKVHMAFMNLPHHLQQGIVDGGWNKGSLELENGSRVIALATGDATARGYSANMLVIDEAAHIENWEDFSKSTLPIISSGTTTKTVLISTPNGLNHFYKYWHLAQFKDVPEELLPPGVKWNGYIPLFVDWKQVPGRDETWLKETMEQLNHDKEKFEQEFNCGFIGSSGTLISSKALKELCAQIPIYHDESLKKYKDPEPGHNYILVADTSEGKGFDYCAFSVIDITAKPFIQVATFRNNMTTPGDYAEHIYRISKAYNEAQVFGESTSLWPVVVKTLKDTYEFEHLLYTENAGRAGQRLAGFASEKKSEPGLKISVNSKALGCSMLKLLIEEHQLILTDHQTIEELSRFVKSKNSWAAEQGWNDDLVMGLVLFAWLTKQERFQSLNEIDISQRLREKTPEQIEDQLMPFGFIQQQVPVEEEVEVNLPTERWFAVKQHPMSIGLFPTVGRVFVDDEDEDPWNF